MIDIEKTKNEYLQKIHELQIDINTLTVNINAAIEDLISVHTENDVEIFNKKHDLENGLTHIVLF